MPFFNRLFFQSSLSAQDSWVEDPEVSHIPALTPHLHSLPHNQHPHRSGALVTIAQPVLTYIIITQSTIYIRVHAWCLFFFSNTETIPQIFTEHVLWVKLLLLGIKRCKELVVLKKTKKKLNCAPANLSKFFLAVLPSLHIRIFTCGHSGHLGCP